MTRVAVALAVVIALAAGVWILWPDDERAPSTTVPVAASSTSSSTIPAPSTTNTSSEAGHIVETVEEAEAILRDFWFGWFEGIYKEDEALIRPLVATEEAVALARNQFGVLEFANPPTAERIVLDDVEVLRGDEGCLAVWASLDADSLTGASTEGVHVFRWIDQSWKYISLWAHRNDLWQDDC